MVATQETANQLRKIRMTQRHVRHTERRDHLDTGALEITALVHNDIAKPHEPTSAQRLDLLLGGCDEGGDPIPIPLIEPPRTTREPAALQDSNLRPSE